MKTGFKYFFILLIAGFSFCADPDKTTGFHPQKTDSLQIAADSSARPRTQKKPGLYLFIDSMKKANYLVDTSRLRQVEFWNWLAGRFPKGSENGVVFIQMPFVLDSLAGHFSVPRTYFFAEWKDKERTFKNGNDYILMTWKMDDFARANEKDIYRAFMYRLTNFPCYFIRANDRLYILSHRMSVMDERTKALAEKLKIYLGEKALMFGYYNLYTGN